MFDIEFLDKEMKKQFAYQTSWGFTTRSIGILVMIHGDNQGLVLPPGVAMTQVVVIPIVRKDVDAKKLGEVCESIKKRLLAQKIRVVNDDREGPTIGRKYNEWEIKGVPIRIEIGQKELENGTFRLVRRFDGDKQNYSLDNLEETIQ